MKFIIIIKNDELNMELSDRRQNRNILHAQQKGTR